jgi:hypothetical protein
MTADPITAILDQLAAHAEQIARLDAREAASAAEANRRIADLALLAAALDRHVTDLAARISPDPPGDADPGGHVPAAARRWWKLAGKDRDQAITDLREWVEEVYRPGYGQLAAALGPCWDQHVLCLYALDILAELHLVLYQPGQRSPAVLSAQAEHQARVLPALARADEHRDQPVPARSRTPHHPGSGPAAVMTANPVLAQALAYARHGWPVFPCRPGQKIPATRHGYRDASADPDQITRWFSDWPDRNLAIATGSPGPDVLDVDVHPDGDGFAALRTLARAGLSDGAAAIVRTPSGGAHRYYAGSAQRCGHLPGHPLDFRAQGGYVLAPPSCIDAKTYTLISRPPGRSGLDWAAVTRLLEPARSALRPPSPGLPAGTHYLAGWVARLEEGNRNAGLYWAACRALEADRAADLDPLAAASRQAGLGDREIRATLESARNTTGPGRVSGQPQAEAGC